MYDVGTKVYGFEFEDNHGGRSFTYLYTMDKHVGEIGTVILSSKNSTSLEFASGKRYSYPTEMIEYNLVEKEPEIDLKELLTQIKSL